LCTISAAWLSWPEPSDNRAVVGLWERIDLQAPDDVRYYYFHPDGLGLYRFGKQGLNYTHMFRYELRGSKLRLRFLRTGEKATTTFSVEAACPYGHARSSAWLVLDRDPREDGRRVRYRRRPPASTDLHGLFSPEAFDRMWVHEETLPGGKRGFAIYQFQKPDADGNGRGWFHRGDFDEWSTESLAYRRLDGQLTLEFDLGGRFTTPLVETGRKPRRLTLDRDPRYFWHRRTYVDRGPSFAVRGD
jgi:hypothetical protein